MRSIRLLMLIALALFIAPGSVAAGQQEEVGPGPYKRTVLDLTYRVVDLVGGANTMAGGASALSGRVEPLEVKETPTEIHIALAADVLFDFDRADIRPEAASALKSAAAILRERARGPVRIEGHTDAKGSDAYNQTLSVRRADAVRLWLVQKEGLKSVTFTSRGFGAKNPAAPNTNPDGSDNPAGRQKNRRVEIIAGKG